MTRSSSIPRQKVLQRAVWACAAALVVSPAVRAQAEPEATPAAATAASPPAVLAEPLVDSGQIPMKNLLQVMRDGGPLMIPIGLCSVILMVFVFERLFSLRRGRVIPRPFVKRFLQQLRDGQLSPESALELCDQNRSPVAEVFAAAIRKWGRPAVEVEQGIIDAGERVTNELRKYLRVINGISTVTPLLGLLGTVVGMIQTFNTIAVGDAMGRPEMLAGGIGQALLTTAGGLSVAIPALIVYLYFVGRVDRLIMDIDGLSQRIVDVIAADGQRMHDADRPAGEKKTKKVA
ncbi:MAG: MotA/TolQ/ExbB proton channel family protein [Candidatus Anammoximicrobium sp.]|nr:MotA/TolQ/ExbB proton channel family protein [Candidatus Anammoximicrobium sp.]